MCVSKIYSLIEVSCNYKAYKTQLTADECFSIAKTVLRITADHLATGNTVDNQKATVLRRAHEVLATHEF